MIQIEGIGKSFGAQVVDRDLSWNINRDERIGLVGPNGAGKTTLCRILIGQIEVDGGQVRWARSVTIGYLPQEIAPAGDGTVLGHLLAGFPQVQRLEDELELLANEMAGTDNGASEELMRRYGDLQHQYEALGGYDLEARAKAILGGLGFSPDSFHDYYMEKKLQDQPPAASRPPSAKAQKPESPAGPQRPAPSRRSLEAAAVKTSPKEIRRSEAEARQRKGRAAAPLRARLRELETEIAKMEERIRDLSDQMANRDLYKDGERAREVARERKSLEKQVGSLHGKWEELAQRLESAMAGEA
jgi:energy-coupling factor transporter ATP-binding protein EcfA2